MAGNSTAKSVWLLLSNNRLRAVLQSVTAILESSLEGLILTLFATIGVSLIGSSADPSLELLGTLSESQLVIALFSAVFLRWLLGLMRIFLTTSIRARLTTKLRRELIQAFSRANFEAQRATSDGTLQQTTVSYPQKVAGHVNALLTHLGNFWSMIVLLGLSITVQPWFSLFLTVGLLVVSASIVPLRRWVYSRTQRRLSKERELSNSMAASLRSAESLTIYNVQHNMVESALTSSAEEVSISRRTQFVSGAIGPTYSSLAYVFIGVAISVGSFVSSLNVAEATPAVLLTLRALTYAQGLQGAMLTLSNLGPLLETISLCLADWRSSKMQTGELELDHFESFLFSRVKFRFRGESDSALEIDALSFSRGERVALVGRSGAGKSTLARLILGVVEAPDGTVKVNGVPRNQISAVSWHRLIASVPQDVDLIEGSVLDNVRYFRHGLSDEDVIEALTRANLLDEVEELRQGVLSELGPSTRTLSGGQRQRLGIARALAGKPELLVLDEPTAALDSVSEERIRQTLAELPRDVTLFVISHRDALLPICSRLLVVEGGKIIEDRPRLEGR